MRRPLSASRALSSVGRSHLLLQLSQSHRSLREFPASMPSVLFFAQRTVLALRIVRLVAIIRRIIGRVALGRVRARGAVGALGALVVQKAATIGAYVLFRAFLALHLGGHLFRASFALHLGGHFPEKVIRDRALTKLD